MEGLALIGLLTVVRTKLARVVGQNAWSKLRGASNKALPDFQAARDLAKFDPKSMFSLSSYAMRAREVALQGGAKFSLVLNDLKNRMKNPVIWISRSSPIAFKSTETVNSATVARSISGEPFKPYLSRIFTSPKSINRPFDQCLQVNTQQNNLQQNNYGLFHWYGRYGRSEQETRDFGKKRFWQGVAAGGFGMAWIMKSNKSEDKERKRVV